MWSKEFFKVEQKYWLKLPLLLKLPQITVLKCSPTLTVIWSLCNNSRQSTVNNVPMWTYNFGGRIRLPAGHHLMWWCNVPRVIRMIWSNVKRWLAGREVDVNPLNVEWFSCDVTHLHCVMYPHLTWSPNIWVAESFLSSLFFLEDTQCILIVQYTPIHHNCPMGAEISTELFSYGITNVQ